MSSVFFCAFTGPSEKFPDMGSCLVSIVDAVVRG